MVPTSTNSRLDVFEGLKNAIYKHSLKSHFHIILSSHTNITSNNQLNCPKKKTPLGGAIKLYEMLCLPMMIVKNITTS